MAEVFEVWPQNIDLPNYWRRNRVEDKVQKLGRAWSDQARPDSVLKNRRGAFIYWGAVMQQTLHRD